MLALQGENAHGQAAGSYVELAALEGADPLRLPGEDDERDDDDVAVKTPETPDL